MKLCTRFRHSIENCSRQKLDALLRNFSLFFSISSLCCTPAFAASQWVFFWVQPGTSIEQIINTTQPCDTNSAVLSKSILAQNFKAFDQNQKTRSESQWIVLWLDPSTIRGEWEISSNGSLRLTKKIIASNEKCLPSQISNRKLASERQHRGHHTQPEMIEAPRGKSDVTHKSESWLGLSPFTYFSSLSAVDRTTKGTARLISTLGFGSTLSWLKVWRSGSENYFNFAVKSNSFEKPQTKTLDHARQSLTRLGAGFVFGTRQLRLGIEIGMQQSAILNATSATNLDFVSVQIPYFSLLSKLHLYSEDSSTLGIQSQISYSPSASSSDLATLAGVSSLGARLFLTETFNAFRLTGSAFATQNSNSTKSLMQNIFETGFELRLEWRFGASKQAP